MRASQPLTPPAKLSLPCWHGRSYRRRQAVSIGFHEMEQAAGIAESASAHPHDVRWVRDRPWRVGVARVPRVVGTSSKRVTRSIRS